MIDPKSNALACISLPWTSYIIYTVKNCQILVKNSLWQVQQETRETLQRPFRVKQKTRRAIRKFSVCASNLAFYHRGWSAMLSEFAVKRWKVFEESLGRDETRCQTWHELFYKSPCYPMMPYICCIWSFPQSRSLVSSPPCLCQICRRTTGRSCWTFLCWQKRCWNSKLRASAPLVIPWQGRVLVLNKK